MAPRHCCCIRECEIGADNFNRANANPPTGLWHVIGGEWKIEDNELINVTPGALATTICHPAYAPLGSVVARFRLMNIADGAVYKVRLGDPQGAVEVHITFAGAPDAGTVTRTTIGATTETFISDWLSVGESEEASAGYVTVCYAPGLQISQSGPSLVVLDTGMTISGDTGDAFVTSLVGTAAAKRCHTHSSTAVGNFAFLDGDFDDWSLTIEYMENDDCQTCDCVCEDTAGRFAFPKVLTATITDRGECSGLAGSYPMSQSYAFWDTGAGGVFEVAEARGSAIKEMWASAVINCPLSNGAIRLILLCLAAGDRKDANRPNVKLIVSSGGFIFSDNPSFQLPFNAVHADSDSDNPVDGFHVGHGDWGEAFAKTTSSCSPLDLEFPLFETLHDTREEGEYCCKDYGDMESGPDGVIEIVITEPV